MAGNVEYHATIKDLPSRERPRERLLEAGARYLSSAELLAIILRTGVQDENAISLAQRLLGSYGGLTGLARAASEELVGERGLGPAKVAQVKAALELGWRLGSEDRGEQFQVRSPADAAALLRGEMEFLQQEELRVLCLDNKNRVVANTALYRGSVNSTLVRAAEVFREAIRRTAPAILIAHNHPSGDPTPSPEDVAVTRQIVEAGKLLDIDVLDHLIIGAQGYVSLKERGLGFS